MTPTRRGSVTAFVQLPAECTAALAPSDENAWELSAREHGSHHMQCIFKQFRPGADSSNFHVDEVTISLDWRKQRHGKSACRKPPYFIAVRCLIDVRISFPKVPRRPNKASVKDDRRRHLLPQLHAVVRNSIWKRERVVVLVAFHALAKFIRHHVRHEIARLLVNIVGSRWDLAVPRWELSRIGRTQVRDRELRR